MVNLGRISDSQPCTERKFIRRYSGPKSTWWMAYNQLQWCAFRKALVASRWSKNRVHNRLFIVVSNNNQRFQTNGRKYLKKLEIQEETYFLLFVLRLAVVSYTSGSKSKGSTRTIPMRSSFIYLKLLRLAESSMRTLKRVHLLGEQDKLLKLRVHYIIFHYMYSFYRLLN